MYLVTPSQTPKPVSCGWGNTWARPSAPTVARARRKTRRAGDTSPRTRDPPSKPGASHARTPASAREGGVSPGAQGPEGGSFPLPAPPRREGARAPGREGTRVYKQGGGSAGGRAPREGEGCRERGPRLAGPLAGHSPRPLSPIASSPGSPGSGSGVCCPPAAAAAAGSSQGRRRRHRDATPQCISLRTPTGPHCPAACRWGRKGGRAAQDMVPG